MQLTFPILHLSQLQSINSNGKRGAASLPERCCSRAHDQPLNDAHQHVLDARQTIGAMEAELTIPTESLVHPSAQEAVDCVEMVRNQASDGIDTVCLQL